MPYTSKNLNLTTQGIVGPKSWVYLDTGDDESANYAVAGFFSDAKDKGVSVGDQVSIYEAASAVWQSGHMSAVQDTGGTTGTWTNDTGQ